MASGSEPPVQPADNNPMLSVASVPTTLGSGRLELWSKKMPTGPNGQKRPADAVANAVMVARIATGEITDEIEIPGRVGGKTAGGVARAAKLAPEERARIASRAAEARWSLHKEATIMQTTKGTAAGGHEAVRMYPDNRLPAQVREVSETPSVFAVVREAFAKRA